MFDSDSEEEQKGWNSKSYDVISWTFTVRTLNWIIIDPCILHFIDEGVGDLIADIFGESDDEEEFTGFGQEEISKKDEKKSSPISESEDERSERESEGENMIFFLFMERLIPFFFLVRWRRHCFSGNTS